MFDTICHHGIHTSRLTGFLWGQMKPFIRGKILFSPDTPAARRIMSAVNATFSPIEGVRRYAILHVTSCDQLSVVTKCGQ